MNTRQDEVYIGIDLNNNWTQISYYRQGMKEPETVSTIAGEERYRIPTALYKVHKSGPWYLTDTEGKRPGSGDGIHVDGLWERCLRDETLVLSEEYDMKELLMIFLRKVIRLVPDMTDLSRIGAITFHLDEIEMKGVELLHTVTARMGIDREKVFIQDSKESFCHFAMNQEKELMQHEVVLFLCEENRVTCFYLIKNERTSPKSVEIQSLELGELPAEQEKRDAVFAKKAEDALHGKLVSAVYLMGDGFEGSWLKDALHIICRGRRAFQGKNLFTKGACYEGIMQMHKKECEYVYFSEYKLSKNIFIQVRNGSRTFFHDLAEAGSSCYEVNGSCQVLLAGEPCVDVWLQSPSSGKARIESLELTDLPKRPGKATRLRIEAVPGGKKQVLIRITDLGFGRWYASSGKVWEYCIDE